MIAYVGEYYPITYEKTGKYVCDELPVAMVTLIYCRYTTSGVPSVCIFLTTSVCTLGQQLWPRIHLDTFHFGYQQSSSV